MEDGFYGNWNLVLWNVIRFGLLGLFVLTIPFKKKLELRSAGIYTAFIIALYFEMYGFPLTIYVLAWLFEYRVPSRIYILAGIVGEQFFANFLLPLSVSMTIVGPVLIIVGWWKIHRARGKLVSDGIYRFTRHPQYLGILMLTFGMLVRWLTIPNLLMWPVLLLLYYRLAREEEKEMDNEFGDEYQEYRTKVSMFIPFFRA